MKSINNGGQLEGGTSLMSGLGKDEMNIVRDDYVCIARVAYAYDSSQIADHVLEKVFAGADEHTSAVLLP